MKTFKERGAGWKACSFEKSFCDVPKPRQPATPKNSRPKPTPLRNFNHWAWRQVTHPGPPTSLATAAQSPSWVFRLSCFCAAASRSCNKATTGCNKALVCGLFPCCMKVSSNSHTTPTTCAHVRAFGVLAIVLNIMGHLPSTEMYASEAFGAFCRTCLTSRCCA